jgi:hypothetical protein
VTFSLRRISNDDLVLTSEHEIIAKPRKTDIHWDNFRADEFTSEQLDAAARDWRERALQEFHSLALFTQLTTQIHTLGAPLDWSGAFARMIADEVRHTDLCLQLCAKLERPQPPLIQPDELHLALTTPLIQHVRAVVIAAFCIGETISGRMFKRSLQAATVPLAREVVTAILVDESFHEALGWELAALLMREITENERQSLAAQMPELFAHYAHLCGATAGPAWAHRELDRDPEPNFGTLTHAGYARAFFESMAEDVVPGLVALGFPEATAAYEKLVKDQPPEPP